MGLPMSIGDPRDHREFGPPSSGGLFLGPFRSHACAPTPWRVPVPPAARCRRRFMARHGRQAPVSAHSTEARAARTAGPSSQERHHGDRPQRPSRPRRPRTLAARPGRSAAERPSSPSPSSSPGRARTAARHPGDGPRHFACSTGTSIRPIAGRPQPLLRRDRRRISRPGRSTAPALTPWMDVPVRARRAPAQSHCGPTAATGAGSLG